jgi:opacity protein-like surface antigen
MKVEKVTQHILQSNKKGERIMRKFIIIIVSVVLLSWTANASDVIVELRAHYLHPSEEAFRDIYGGGMMYGGEVSIGVWKGLEVWFGGSYFSKKGELTFTKEETKLEICPLGGGLKYKLKIGVFNLYAGAGLNYYQYKESNPLGDVSKGGLGCIGKIGSYVKVTEDLLIDLYINYSYCKLKPADFEINIGGIEAGVGIGYSF